MSEFSTMFVHAWINLQREAYELARSKGWHDQPREDGTMIALIHSELSEALEYLRKPGDGVVMSEKLPTHLGVEEELADVVIRIMDFAAVRNFDVAGAIVAKHEFNRTRSHRHGGKNF